MKILTPRNSFSLDYTPKQWVGLSNTLLLLFVTTMFGLVVYNMNSLDQRLIRVLDSSVVAIDLLATDLLQSQTSSYWRTINEDISVYSAFYRRTEGNSVLIVGSSPRNVVDIEDLRCLIKYEGEDDINIAFVDYRWLSNCSSSVFLDCRVKRDAEPLKVAVVSYSNNIPKQWMEVKTIRSGVSRPSTIAACVRPLMGRESIKEIAEFIAFYEMIGLSHFYFYNQNAAPDVVEFILRLKGMGHSINFLPWNKQELISPDVCPVYLSEHVQDCSHRAANTYSYVVTVGVSDFVVPIQHFGLPALVEDTYKKVSHLRMNYANFCDVLDSRTSIDRIAIKRMTVRGEIQLSNSNYILRPEPTFGFQMNSKLTNGTRRVGTMNANDVIVHRHSKNCESGGRLDRSAYKYVSLLDQSNVMQIYKRISKYNRNQITFAST